MGPVLQSSPGAEEVAPKTVMTSRSLYLCKNNNQTGQPDTLVAVDCYYLKMNIPMQVYDGPMGLAVKTNHKTTLSCNDIKKLYVASVFG
jgi:hypothetical protein